VPGPRDRPRAPDAPDQVPRGGGRDQPEHQGRPRDSADGRDGAADRRGAQRADSHEARQQDQRPDRRLSAEDERRMRVLESFPPGHPSSPYLADGRRRPPESTLHSMRDYEFRPPPEYAEYAKYLGYSDGARREAEPDGETERETRTGQEAKPEDRVDGRVDGGAKAGQEAREPGEDGWRGDANRPGQDERQPPEASVENGSSGSDGSGTYDGSEGSGLYDAPRDPEDKHFSYWTEVPRFMRMWGEHEQRWPEHEQPGARVDRSRDPEGSWRSDSNLFLSPEKNDRAKGAINGVREAEKRVTPDLQQIVQDSSAPSAELVGLEFRCKGDDRLKEKIAEAMERRPDMVPEEALRKINDAVRYTVRLGREDYTAGYESINQNLQERGYEMFYAENHWQDAEYKGINTRWLTPEGQRFELQFHTRESYHAKQEVTHQAYERIRNPLTTRAEIAQLETFQTEVSSWIPIPDTATRIPSHRREIS
jgi:hypothetical protein